MQGLNFDTSHTERAHIALVKADFARTSRHHGLSTIIQMGKLATQKQNLIFCQAKKRLSTQQVDVRAMNNYA